MKLANGVGDLDFAHVRALVAEFESAGTSVGGQDFAIAKLELVPASAPPGDITCPPVGGARHAPRLPAPTR
jgi:hypothetical protein